MGHYMNEFHNQKKLFSRGSGILLHPSSLPSPFGIGDFGPTARRFADFLRETRQKYWQILPLTPTDIINGNSPYHSDSAYALNPLFISPVILMEEGLLSGASLENTPEFPLTRVDYPLVFGFKEGLISQIQVQNRSTLNWEEFEWFKDENKSWLYDYALYKVLKAHHIGKPWYEWPIDLRDRQSDSIENARDHFSSEIQRILMTQYLLKKQWTALRDYCNGNGIWIIGDIPIYVVHDSADVWVNPGLFNLDDNKRPYTVAGVPPDYFSETGQYWGNPVYRWDVLRDRGYDWWIDRIKYNLGLYDLIRIDHFRGFVAYWEIPAGEPNAINGRWVEAPGLDFFKRIMEVIPELPVIAEDLGFITEDVIEVIRQLGFPGMKILLFAFGDDPATNPYAPHNIPKNCLIYTGTHDNNTAKGWFRKEVTPEMRNKIELYVGRELSDNTVAWELIRLAMKSIGDKAIFPMQDILNLGEEARMNTPGIQKGNWEWRLEEGLLSSEVKVRLRNMTEIYGRA